MKLLLTGVRGVGKSTVGALAEQATGFSLVGLSDLLRKEFPDFNGSSQALRVMLEALPTQERTAAYAAVIRKLRTSEHCILEMPIVEHGPFGMMLPRESLLRLVPFDAFLLLEADPKAIRQRRLTRPSKQQDPRYLDESGMAIGAHQELCRMMIVALGAALAIPVFIIWNGSDPTDAARAVIAATVATNRDAAFNARLRNTS